MMLGIETEVVIFFYAAVSGNTGGYIKNFCRITGVIRLRAKVQHKGGGLS